MSGVYDELIKEGAKLKDEHLKKQFMNKLFFKLIVAVIYTFSICSIYSRLNFIFDFYSEFASIILFVVIFFIMLKSIVFENESRQMNIFFIYMSVFAFGIIPKFDFSNLSEKVLKIFLILLFTFVILLISKFNKKEKIKSFIFTVLLIILFLVYVLCIKLKHIFIFILGMTILFYVFCKIYELMKEESIKNKELNKNFYSYLFCIYTLFMCMCMIVI